MSPWSVPITPKLFSIDSRQNFYFYSLETHSLYKTRSLSGEFDLFLDLLDDLIFFVSFKNTKSDQAQVFINLRLI